MPLITDSVGRVLGKRYRLVSALGTGASAHVFLAEDVSLQRHVAVKLLQPGLAHDPSFLKRFSAEARSVASLNHPHVLQVFDWGEDAEGPYLVAEYLDGGSLRDLLDRGVRLDHAQAARLGSEVAQGLAYAHARGLVHRDIKPANLLFDEEGRVRVADFGVARALAQAAWTEPEGAMVGTARYASPEQAEGRQVDGRADVYSLSLVLYEALTGEVPFVADTTVGTLMARVGAPLPMDERLGPLAPVLARGAAPEVGERLNAAELAAELDSLALTTITTAPLPIGRFAGRDDPDATAVVAGVGQGAGGGRASGAGSGAFKAGPGEVFDVEAFEGGTAAAGRAGAAVGVGTGTIVEPRMAPAPDVPVDGGGVAIHARPRRRWPWVVAAVLVVAALVAGGAVYAAKTKLFTPSQRVPAVVGLSVPAAQHALAHLHLDLRTGAPVYSTTVHDGLVVSQSPARGTMLKQGSSVQVVASKGPPPVAIPSLATVDCPTAQRLLAASHLSGVCPVAAEAYSSNIPDNQVINWTYGGKPNPTVAPYGSVITIAISKGPPPLPVPNVAGSGSSYSAAVATLQAAGLTPSESREYSTTVPAGQVVGTTPPVGTTVPHGSPVVVVVSAGPPMVPVPNLHGDSVAAATAQLHKSGLSVGQVYGPSDGRVFDASPSMGTSVQQGSSVNLYTK
jgi:serine/threonine-protein kinase